MRNRKVGFVLLAFGLVALLRIPGNPRLETLHGADIVALIGTGMCLGGGLVSLLLLIRHRQ